MFKKRKYIFILFLLYLSAFCLYFALANEAVTNTVVRQQAYEKEQDLNLIAALADFTAINEINGLEFSYIEFLNFTIGYIEEHYNFTFAQVYDAELNALHELNPGVSGGVKHDPLEYPAFVNAVTQNNAGNLIYTYETPEAGSRDIYMYYRWIPDSTLEVERYLVCIAISRHTIKATLNPLIMYGAMFLTLSTAIILIYTAIYANRLIMNSNFSENKYLLFEYLRGH